MKLFVFASGACFGAVVGIMVGWMLNHDEQRERDQMQRFAKVRPTEDPHGQTTGTDDPMGPVLKRIAMLKERTQKDPTDADAWIGLGEMYYRAAKWPKAIEYLEQAVALRPKEARLIHWLGTAYYQNGQLDEAATRFRKVVDLMPDNGEAVRHLANSLAGQKKTDEALMVLQKGRSAVKDAAERDKIDELAKEIRSRAKKPEEKQ